MSLFDIFTPKPETPPAIPAPTPAPVPAGGEQLQNVDPSALAPSAAPSTEAVLAEPSVNSPLDQFKDMWDPIKTEPTADGIPAALDPVTLQEVIAKADFSKSLTPENLSKIAAGGEEAMTAFSASLNSVAQQVMMQSTLAANKMIKAAAIDMAAAQKASLPKLIKDQNLSASMQAANPVFNNPAVKPVIEAVKVQLAAKNPNASVAELTEMAQNFVTVMGESFAPAPINTPSAEDSVDWDAYLTR